MRRFLYAGLVGAGLVAAALAGPAAAQPKAESKTVVAALPPGAVVKPVALTRVRALMSGDQQVGSLTGGVFCLNSIPVTWGKVAPSFNVARDVFAQELKAAGFKPAVDPSNLFADQQSSVADLQVGALFKHVDVTLCDATLTVSGKVSLDIEWQVYSSLRREVVTTVETHGTAEKSRGVGARDEGRSVYQMAIAENVRGLLASEAFRKVATAPDAEIPSAAMDAAARTPIRLAGETAGPTAISDAVGSVVSIFAGGGFGSGVLVSSDGYLLTNHHVVGETSQVKVRWSDGFETAGEVVRSDRRRDVALVKTEPRGRVALALNRSVPPVGTQVFAVGTPLDPKLQSTVTRGIVSAVRIVDGFSFIQSDTPVTHGNSGGPLLDEHGAVVGLTDWGIPAAQGSTLNFFIPIGDALDFLALKTGN
jgi:serine protease Do